MSLYNPNWTGSDQCYNINDPEGGTMSKMLKEAQPVAKAAVISVAIVIAALAVPAEILYVAVLTRKLQVGSMQGLTSQCRDSWTPTRDILLELVSLCCPWQSENQRI